jgi:hypothetical protein
MKQAKQMAGLLVALWLLGGLVQAQEASPAATAEPPGKPPSAQEQGAPRAVQPPAKGEADKSRAMPVQRKLPTRRRSVQQVVGPEPTVNLGSPTYSPTLTPRPSAPIGSAPLTATPPGVPAPVMPAPALINSCAGNQCTDSSGGQYNLGTGNAGTNSAGRLCNRVGNNVQCF